VNKLWTFWSILLAQEAETTKGNKLLGDSPQQLIFFLEDSLCLISNFIKQRERGFNKCSLYVKIHTQKRSRYIRM
jgi:hypothetical protein